MDWVLFLFKTMGYKLGEVPGSEGVQGLGPRLVVLCGSQLLNLLLAHSILVGPSWWAHPEPGLVGARARGGVWQSRPSPD